MLLQRHRQFTCNKRQMVLPAGFRDCWSPPTRYRLNLRATQFRPAMTLRVTLAGVHSVNCWRHFRPVSSCLQHFASALHTIDISHVIFAVPPYHAVTWLSRGWVEHLGLWIQTPNLLRTVLRINCVIFLINRILIPEVAFRVVNYITVSETPVRLLQRLSAN